MELVIIDLDQDLSKAETKGAPVTSSVLSKHNINPETLSTGDTFPQDGPPPLPPVTAP